MYPHTQTIVFIFAKKVLIKFIYLLASSTLIIYILIAFLVLVFLGLLEKRARVFGFRWRKKTGALQLAETVKNGSEIAADQRNAPSEQNGIRNLTVVWRNNKTHLC